MKKTGRFTKAIKIYLDNLFETSGQNIFSATEEFGETKIFSPPYYSILAALE